MRKALVVVTLVACRGGSSAPVAKPATDGGRVVDGAAVVDRAAVVANDAPPPDPDAIAAIEPDALVGSAPWVPYRVPCDPEMVCDRRVWWTAPEDADDKDVEDYLFFAAQPFTRDGAPEQIALWQFSDDPGRSTARSWRADPDTGSRCG